LTGTLSATLNNGFFPALGDSFAILTYGSQTGVFSSTNLPTSGLSWQLGYGATNTILTVTQSAAPPLISIQPASQSVAPGGRASFSVSAVGNAPLMYQWQFDGTNLPAATNTNLVFNAVATSNAGNYDVIITNTSGSITSAVVALNVLGVPVSFATSPGGIGFNNGQFYLSLSGLTGQGAVVIEASSNLTEWTPVFTNPPGFGTIQFVDPTAANSRHRYYRATTPGP